MKIYTGTAWGKKSQQKCIQLDIGMMSSPVDLVHPDKIPLEIDVSCDNGAFKYFRDNVEFNEILFYKWLDSIKRKIDFVAVPDRVLGGIAPYELSKKHVDNITHTKYLVVQDGMTFDVVYPVLSKCDGCFIGGSTIIGRVGGWKWNIAPHFIKHCHEIGLMVHMGRCPGNVIALSTAEKIGIDSVDTSTIIRNQKLDRVLKLQSHRKEQTYL